MLPSNPNMLRRAAAISGLTVAMTGALALNAEQANAWEESASAKTYCVPNGGNGEARADLSFVNEDNKAMNIDVVIGGKVVSEHDNVGPDQGFETTVSLGAAPTEDSKVTFVQTWADGKNGSDKVERELEAVAACPPKPTTTTSTSTTTTSTTTPTTVPPTTSTSTSTTTTSVPGSTTTTVPKKVTTTTTPVEVTPPAPELPRTGNEGGLAALGAVAVATGSALAYAASRRRSAGA